MGAFNGLKVVVPGTFDLLHKGHKQLFDFAWLLCGKTYFTVTINGDEFSIQLGKRTDQTEQERVEAIEQYAIERGMKCTVYVVNSEIESLQRTIDEAPCFRLTGNDWDIRKTNERCGTKREFWKENDIYLIYKDKVPNVSSTKLRNAKTNCKKL